MESSEGPVMAQTISYIDTILLYLLHVLCD